MKKKVYTNPSCEVVPFADEVLLSAATNPKKKKDENPSIPIDNSGKEIDNSNQIF